LITIGLTYLGVSKTGVFVRVYVQEVTLIQGKLRTRVQDRTHDIRAPWRRWDLQGPSSQGRSCISIDIKQFFSALELWNARTAQLTRIRSHWRSVDILRILLSLTGCSAQRPSVAEVTVQLNQTKANFMPGIAGTLRSALYKLQLTIRIS
jgi:hypothetical protein